MRPNDALFIVMGDRPREALEFSVIDSRGGLEIFYDVRCVECGERTTLQLGEEVNRISDDRYVVDVNSIASTLARTLILGHGRRCWEYYYGITSRPVLSTVSITGTTGTTGPGDAGIRMARAGVRGASYGSMLKNKLINERKKKKIKLPEFRLIRDD
jgi:hypothetical protein